jgi:hypothetical protein
MASDTTHYDIASETGPDTGAMAPTAPRFAYVRAILLTGLGVLLSWAVVTRSFSAYFAEADPAKALRLNPQQSTALLNLAERRLLKLVAAPAQPKNPRIGASGAETAAREGRVAGFSKIAQHAAKSTEAASDPASAPQGDPKAETGIGSEAAAPVQAQATQSPDGGDARTARAAVLADARDLIMRALATDPLSARGLRMLAQTIEAESTADAAAPLMRLAARWSPRETYATYWMLGRAVESKDYATALTYADTILRSRSQMTPHVTPYLAQIAESPQGNALLKKLLAGTPPWRSQALMELTKSVNDLRTPLDLLLALNETPNPPTTTELKGYLYALVARQNFELAYYTWLQFLPPEQLGNLGLLFNGNFEIAANGLPFDWELPVGSGYTVQITPRPDKIGERALRIVFANGRASFAGLRQMTMLGPGTYRIEGSHMGELAGRRGLIWRVSCLPATSEGPLGTSKPLLGSVQAWTAFSFQFTVPPTGCRAQHLGLVLDARSESEKLLSGTAWYDDIKISRLAEPAKP